MRRNDEAPATRDPYEPTLPNPMVNEYGETFPLRKLSFKEWLKLHLGL